MMELIIQSGGVTFYPERNIVKNGGDSVQLTRRQTKILMALAVRRGRILTKDALLDIVDPGVHVEDGTVRKNISLLRKMLGHIGANFIETCYGDGYRWAAVKEQVYTGIAQGGPLDGQKLAARQTMIPYSVLVASTGDSGGPAFVEVTWYRHEIVGDSGAWLEHRPGMEAHRTLTALTEAE